MELYYWNLMVEVVPENRRMTALFHVSCGEPTQINFLEAHNFLKKKYFSKRHKENSCKYANSRYQYQRLPAVITISVSTFV